MSTYRNSAGVVVSAVSLKKLNRRYWVIYRQEGKKHNFTMLRDDFYREFQMIPDIAEGQQQ